MVLKYSSHLFQESMSNFSPCTAGMGPMESNTEVGDSSFGQGMLKTFITK